MNRNCLLQLIIAAMLLCACDKDKETENNESTNAPNMVDYIKRTGDTMTGPLTVSAQGLHFPDGTLQTTASVSGTSCIGSTCLGDTTFSGQIAITGSLSAQGAVVAQDTLEVNNSITTHGNLSVDGAIVCTDCVGHLALSSDSVTSGKIANDAITSDKIIDGAVIGSKITAGAIVSSHIAASAITSLHIANDSISSVQISNSSISTSKLENYSVTPEKVSAGAPAQILTTNANSQAAWSNALIQYGLHFSYLNSSRIRFTPSGVDGRASVLVSDGTHVMASLITSALDADLTISGAGGLDTGSESGATGYDVYLITDNQGENPSLLLTISGASPQLPSGYSLKSDVLWFISNSIGTGSADIVPFVDLGQGECQYQISQGLSALTGGSSTTVTAIDLTNKMPSASKLAILSYRAINPSAVSYSLELSTNAAGTSIFQSMDGIGGILGGLARQEQQIQLPIFNTLSTSLYYKFTGSLGSPSLNLYVKGWRLPRRMN
ncbi:MAG: hypothetical protein K2Q26_06480 [Bdellovibrionales bacterium]|nr:hypothetical protein [Bdellovibrionales bacterium]